MICEYTLKGFGCVDTSLVVNTETHRSNVCILTNRRSESMYVNTSVEVRDYFGYKNVGCFLR